MFFIINRFLRTIYIFYFFVIICNHSGNGFYVTEFLGNLKDNILYYSLSPVFETCDSRWVTQDILKLEKDLQSHVFGQHIATEVVLVALQSHLSKEYRKKPLVLNFHGWTGGGKGYVGNFILSNFFKKGEKSKFVRRYLARIHFPLDSEAISYQKRLQNELEETISRCSKAVFIFDEVDKYPPKVLDGIKAYLDVSSDVNGYDFREAIFIFITNNGQRQITDIALQKYKDGIQREDLQLRDFERVLKTASFNDEGGFFQSDLIKHHLIDYVVPFLPLERRHVEMCIEAEMIRRRMDLSNLSAVTKEIMEESTFGPEGSMLFSVNGCKNIGDKVDFINVREKRRNRLLNSEL